MMTTGRAAAAAEEYLQVMKTEGVGLGSPVLTGKPLISLLDTMPHESLTLSANLHLKNNALSSLLSILATVAIFFCSLLLPDRL